MIFLAHVGAFPAGQSIQGLTISPLNEHESVETTNVKLRSTGGSRHDLLACVDSKTVGLLRSQEHANDIWIRTVQVFQPYRYTHIAHALLKSCVATAYSKGYRSIIGSVAVDDRRMLQLYQQVGFRDEIYRQWCYRPTHVAHNA